jgi:HPt (histidine-containing phosphotransfer) domain-containing protein
LAGLRDHSAVGNQKAPVPVIDMPHLVRQTFSDVALMCEILELFRQNTPAYVERLQQAQSHSDWRAAAHTLKGTARTIGAARLADLALEAEAMAERADLKDCKSILPLMRNALRATERQIAQILEERR